MRLFWKIRYLDRTDKQFKDRNLYLSTKSLDPVTRAAFEYIAENRTPKIEREVLKYKHLFVEDNADRDNPADRDKFSTVGPSEYLEDETGKEITQDELAQILTGSSTARVIPRGAKQHDIDLMSVEDKPIPLAEVSLNNEEIRLLGYFARDLQEMLNSAFLKDTPCSLISYGRNTKLETAATDEEIRSFVMIFRRLYMTSDNDPANFSRIVPIFVKAIGSHPYGKWVEGAANEYKRRLDSPPDDRPFASSGRCKLTTKLLIDVFLYTQYAHQPNEKRQRQFKECLVEVDGDKNLLTYLFLSEIWKRSLEIGNVGKLISWWFKRYCDHHGVSPDVLDSLYNCHIGIGTAEKERDRQERILEEKVQQLASELWAEAGYTHGGPSQYCNLAREQLTKLLSR